MKKITKSEYEKGVRQSQKMCQEFFLENLEKWIKRNYGIRCEEFARACPNCEAWRMRDKLNSPTS